MSSIPQYPLLDSREQPRPELRRRVFDAIHREPAPTRTQCVVRRLAIALAGFVPSIVVVGMFAHEGVGRPASYVAFVAGTWALLATVATWMAVGRARSMSGSPRVYLIATAVSAPVLLAALAGLAAIAWPETNVVDSDAYTHVTCFALTTLCALGPVVAFSLLCRQSDPVHPRATAAIIGAAAGAWGATAVALFCGHTQLIHILVGHVLPVIPITVAGALLAARVVALRGKQGSGSA